MSKAGITTYVVVNDRDQYINDVEYPTYRAALEAAQREDRKTAVVELHYAFDDSELVWTSTGDRTWPPTVPEEERDPVGDEPEEASADA